jgi:YebC/PmpR family DNA-binding regulatory protein
VSGHSKWATIKHKKAAVDKARGKLFAKLARQLEVSAREGGGDPASNATLRTMVQKAKAAQMTNDAIDRAIKRGTGEDDGSTYESITYEGYAPGGVAMLIDVLTDNRNRTAGEVRSLFTKLGGSLAEPGAVAWQFSRRGVVLVDGSAGEERLLEVALDAGADDVARDGESWRVTCDPSIVYDVKASLESSSLGVQSAESTMISSVVVEVTDRDAARAVLRIMDELEDNDDVQDVYANFDIPETLLAELAS